MPFEIWHIAIGSPELLVQETRQPPDRRPKKPGQMRVRLFFFVDGCDQNRRQLRTFKSLGVKDMSRVIFHRTDSEGLPVSPPVFFGLMIQRYSLNGFPPAEEAAMRAAIPVAIDTVKKCDKLSWWGKYVIPPAIRMKRYDYKEDLGLCGWTFPASWYIEIGKNAFDKSKCCDLPSTIAHEASHTEFYTEGRARKMECNCFGCSC